MAEKESKQAKSSDHDGEQLDRLSALPDEILHQILSRVTTKFAGRTSVLSTRWRSLWKRVPLLNLDSHPYRGRKSGKSDFEQFVGSDGVSNVLSLRDGVSNVDALRFVYDFPLRRRTDCDQMNSAIDYAVARKVKYCALYLRAAKGNLSIFPQSIFLSKSLKVLRLGGGYGAFRFKPSKLAKALSASNLSSLYLDYCKFKGSDCLEPFASCPTLKNLDLFECVFDRVGCFRVSGDRLENVSIRNIWQYTPETGFRIEVCAPKLTYLMWANVPAALFSKLDLPSLQRLEIEAYNGEKPQNLVHALSLGPGNVQYVKLRDSTTEVLVSAAASKLLMESQPSPFSGTKLLEVHHNFSYYYKPPGHLAPLITYFFNGSAAESHDLRGSSCCIFRRKV